MAIHIKKSHDGLLHKNLGVAKGKPIPAGKLSKALHSNNAAVKKRAVFAKNAKSWHHGGKKKRKGAQHMSTSEFNRHKAWSK